MTESELRDLLAKNIEVLEPGLRLLDKEKYIPNPVGTKSFIDLYATDLQGNHVLIELKKSGAASREALHEIHKYVEGVKRHLGTRDNEIRVILASLEWKELVVPFSRFVADTKLSICGLQLKFDVTTGLITASLVPVLPVFKGRFIAPWHGVKWYLNRNSLNNGITSIETCCRAKGIDDYVVVILKPEKPIRSERQGAMQKVLRRMAEVGGMSNFKAAELPAYEYVAYFAMQTLTIDKYLSILEQAPDRIQEIRAQVKKMEAEEALSFLHDEVFALEPRPKTDFYEIGYPAKFGKFLAEDFNVEAMKRYGVFARNGVLDDKAILSELRGEDGATGQRFKRTVSIANNAHLATAKSDITTCLELNPVWKNHILRELDDICEEFPNAEVDISIYNPSSGVFTLYFAATRDNGFLFIPSYSLQVRNPGPTRMYYGTLQGNGSSLKFRKIIDKYYDGDLGALLITMSWGGFESRDIDILEDLGCTYRSFRCDIRGEDRDFFRFHDERWRRCKPVVPLGPFAEYLKKNNKLIRQIVAEIGDRDLGGAFEWVDGAE